MEKRTFVNIGIAIRRSRVTARLSQTELSNILGYKNGQYISNVERGLCSIPFDKVPKLAKVLKVSEEYFIEKIVDDTRQTLKNYCFPVEEVGVVL